MGQVVSNWFSEFRDSDSLNDVVFDARGCELDGEIKPGKKPLFKEHQHFRVTVS